jgi:putative thioredoxin
MTGAVDLSALKQRASQQNETSEGPKAGVEITEANFEAEVLVKSNQLPVVVLLWSPRSDVSVQLADLLGGLVSATWSLATVNVDTQPRVAQIFGVQAVPTVVALAAGQPVGSFQGPQPADQLKRWIDSLIAATAGKLGDAADTEPEHVPPELARARDLLNAGDLDAALSAYRSILEADPEHGEAKGAIRQLEFLIRATSQRPDAPGVADSSPDDIDAAFAAADVEILNRHEDAAFDRLTGLVRRTSGDDKTKVRTRLIELFDLFDPSEPAVIAGRRKLANALY